MVAVSEPRHAAVIPVDDPDLVIGIDDASVVRGETYLLREVSWRVELDERWVVLGPNGAGKTTLLNLAAARLYPTRGTVHVLGEKLGRVDVNRPKVGVEFHFDANIPAKAPIEKLGHRANPAVECQRLRSHRLPA